jgi:hypothetical protein
VTVEEAVMAYLKAAIAEGQREMHNEKHHYFYSSPNITRVMKSRMMSWAGYVAHITDPEEK